MGVETYPSTEGIMAFHVPEKYRIKQYSSIKNGNNGMFGFRTEPNGPMIKIIASDGLGWEHVSASLPNRCPTWEEMCFIKDIFWDQSDCVVQYHPSESEYINVHSYCLHLWKPIDIEFPKPQQFMI